MSKETIRVPDVGSSDPVDVIEVSVKKGDTVEAEDTIVVLESDKASLEVPCPKAGTVLELKVKAGDQVKEGDPLLDLDVAGDDAADDESAGEREDVRAAGWGVRRGGADPWCRRGAHGCRSNRGVHRDVP